MVLARLEGGSLLGATLEDTNEGIIGEFLRPAAEQLYSDVIQELKVLRYHRANDSDRPRQEYHRTLGNIVNLAKEKRYGATFVVFPDTITCDDQRLTDRIHLKYILDSPGIWEALIKESIANRNYHRLFFPNKHAYLPHKEIANREI
jgi:hypothetical protein